jgi:hypothetical protein
MKNRTKSRFEPWRDSAGKNDAPHNHVGHPVAQRGIDIDPRVGQQPVDPRLRRGRLCLIACLVVSSRANARPFPIVPTAGEPVLMTPRVAPAFAGAGCWPATQRAWHACHRRTGRQASGEPVQTRGAVAVASPGPANRGCRRDDSRFVSSGQRFDDVWQNPNSDRPGLILFTQLQAIRDSFVTLYKMR